MWSWEREAREASIPLTAPMAPARGWRWVLRALAVRSKRPLRGPWPGDGADRWPLARPAAVLARWEEDVRRRLELESERDPARAPPLLAADRACCLEEDPRDRDDEPGARPLPAPRPEERAEPAGRGRPLFRPLAAPPLLPPPPLRPCAMRQTVPPGSHPARERPAQPAACPGLLAHRPGIRRLALLRQGRPLICAFQVTFSGVVLFTPPVRPLRAPGDELGSPRCPREAPHQGRPRGNRHRAAERIRGRGECRLITRSAPLTADGRWCRRHRWR